MARVFEYRAGELFHRNRAGPRLREDRRVVDSKLVIDSVRIDPCKPFDDSKRFATALEIRDRTELIKPTAGGVEVRRLDDERVSLPMPARVAHPLPNVRSEMRPGVEWDQAS